MLVKFSEELKKAREKAGITLQVVASKTRIDLKFLEALEEGNFNFLPDLYVKAFIKQYARVIGLDEDETIQKYNIAREGKEESSGEIAEESSGVAPGTADAEGPVQTDVSSKQTRSFVDESTNQNSNTGDVKKQNPLIIGGAAFGVVVIAFLGYFLFFDGNDQIIVEEKPYEEVLQKTPSRFKEEVTDTLAGNEITTAMEEISLTIANVDSVDSAWVYVIVDGVTPHEFLLLPNISTSLNANNNFRFTLGNSGVIKLLFNDEEIPFDGSRGAVRHFKLDVNGLERIYFPPQINQE